MRRWRIGVLRLVAWVSRHVICGAMKAWQGWAIGRRHDREIPDDGGWDAGVWSRWNGDGCRPDHDLAMREVFRGSANPASQELSFKPGGPWTIPAIHPSSCMVGVDLARGLGAVAWRLCAVHGCAWGCNRLWSAAWRIANLDIQSTVSGQRGQAWRCLVRNALDRPGEEDGGLSIA